MKRGTAHIVFRGGGLIVPARSPYERQMLREHVLAAVHHEPQLRLDIGRNSWLVKQAEAEHPTVCSVCNRLANRAVCHQWGQPAALCVGCAFR